MFLKPANSYTENDIEKENPKCTLKKILYVQRQRNVEKTLFESIRITRSYGGYLTQKNVQFFI